MAHMVSERTAGAQGSGFRGIPQRTHFLEARLPNEISKPNKGNSHLLFFAIGMRATSLRDLEPQ